MWKWLGKNMFRRLLISYLAIVLLGLALMGVIMWFLTTDHLVQTQEEEMIQQARQINLTLQDSDEITEEKHDVLEFLGESFNSQIWVFNEEGTIKATSTRDEVYIGYELKQDYVDQTLEGQVVRENLDIPDMQRPLMSVIVPWGVEEEVYGGIVLLSSVEGLNAATQSIREAVLWSLLIGILFSLTTMLYISWSLSRPINQVKEAASEIALGNYSKRVPDFEDKGELGDLSETFNRMAEKLETIEHERHVQDQRRAHFISNVSHELRTPLTAMQGFLEALQDGLVRDEPTRQRYYDVMYKEAMYLNRLVDDLMELIKLEKRETSLDLQLVQVEEIAEKVAFTLHSEAQEKGNVIDIDVPEQLPALVADPDRIEQIMINLVHNANKFTQDGQINIRITKETEGLVMTVSDTGIGIPSHDVQKIWDRFFKVSRVRSKKEGGTGLGLAIVKELVELHQGTIEVDSELGRGTTFTIRLPHQ